MLKKPPGTQGGCLRLLVYGRLSLVHLVFFCMIAITSDADVSGLEVRFQVVWTRLVLGKLGVWDSDLTTSST